MEACDSVSEEWVTFRIDGPWVLAVIQLLVPWEGQSSFKRWTDCGLLGI